MFISRLWPGHSNDNMPSSCRYFLSFLTNDKGHCHAEERMDETDIHEPFLCLNKVVLKNVDVVI